MNSRQHSRLARRLVEACGGIDEASDNCRLKRSRLSDAQNPNVEAYLPADVIDRLEQYCGEPVYSRTLADSRPAAIAAGELLAEACGATELSAELQAQIRRLARGPQTRREREAIDTDITALEDLAKSLRASFERVTP